MEEKARILDLVEGVVKEMERLNYSAVSIRIFRLGCRKFLSYVLEKDPQGIFTEEIAANYLHEKYACNIDGSESPSKDGVDAARCVRRLGEYALFGLFSASRVQRRQTTETWALGDAEIVKSYLTDAQTADNKASTKEMRETYVHNFYSFLGTHDADGIKGISEKLISDYVLSIGSFAPSTIHHRLAALRSYFRYLKNNGHCDRDWSHSIPKVRRTNNINVPALWEQEKVEVMLKSIDRGSPLGKRDYAILLLVVQLGLRLSDVSYLRFENLRWERKEINLVQQKTDVRLTLPLLDDVGWAMIDYIRYARPQSDEPFVFLVHSAPYRQMESHTVGDVIRRAMRSAGYGKQSNITSGMHSLRHALARRLLKQGSPLSEVADILGHASFHSSAPYLKVDIDGLRDCCLSIEGGR